MHGVSATEWETRVDLAAAHRLAAISGWTDLIFNHFTVRVPGEPERFLINRHSLLFDEVTASNLVKIDLDGVPAGTDAEVTEPSPEVCEQTAQQFEAMEAKSGTTTEWAAVRRWLDTKDVAYRS